MSNGLCPVIAPGWRSFAVMVAADLLGALRQVLPTG